MAFLSQTSASLTLHMKTVGRVMRPTGLDRVKELSIAATADESPVSCETAAAQKTTTLRLTLSEEDAKDVPVLMNGVSSKPPTSPSHPRSPEPPPNVRAPTSSREHPAAKNGE